MGYKFVAELWLYPGDAAWHFVTIPKEYSDEIKAISSGKRRGFGSVRVKVTIGSYSWLTSVFPDSKSSSYVLPVKKEARKQNNLSAGDKANFSLELVDNF